MALPTHPVVRKQVYKDRKSAEEELPVIRNILSNFNLKVNEAKTEITEVSRTKDDWRKVKKLGSLLDCKEDVKRRKNLASAAFNNMYAIFVRRKNISKERLIHLYNAVVLPILIYNSGTWGLTQQSLNTLDTFHRKHLRHILGFRWEDKIDNYTLYYTAKSSPISTQIKSARWRLFGHILRRDNAIPAQQAMRQYFRPGTKKYPGRKPINLPTTLDNDIRQATPYTDHTYTLPRPGRQLKNTTDLNFLQASAQDRDNWNSVLKEEWQADTRDS